jgi:hypothetical protein
VGQVESGLVKDTVGVPTQHRPLCQLRGFPGEEIRPGHVDLGGNFERYLKSSFVLFAVSAGGFA